MYLLVITQLKKPSNSLETFVSEALEQDDRLMFLNADHVRTHCMDKFAFVKKANEQHTRCSKKLGYNMFHEGDEGDIIFTVSDIISLTFYQSAK